MHYVLTHIALHVSDLPETLRFYEAFCGLRCIHRRGDPMVVAWVAEPGREQEFIIVLIADGPERTVHGIDYSHLGFAVESREEVDHIAARARPAGCLVWEPCEEPYPVGYYCGLRDPDGNVVEFSYGQPLGPGAEALDEARVAAESGDDR